MLDKFHWREIDQAGLTPEQWETVISFIGHNFGTLVGNATMALETCARMPGDPAQIAENASKVRQKYFEIVGTLKELRALALMERENRKLARKEVQSSRFKVQGSQSET